MSWGYDLIYDAPRSPEVQQAVRYTLSRSAAMLGDCDYDPQAGGLAMACRTSALSPSRGASTWRIFPPIGQIRDCRKKAAPFTLLSTRGWEPIYGVDVLARAFAQAARQCPELRLVMLGNGSQAASLRQIFRAGGCVGAGELRRCDWLCRSAGLSPSGRPLPERLAFRRHLDLAAGSPGVRDTGAGLGYPGQPGVDHPRSGWLVVPGWRCAGAG